MFRIAGADAGFFYLESTECSTTVPTAVELRPGPGSGGHETLTFDELRRCVVDHLDALPWFRMRVQQVPLGLGFPVLVPDERFDLDYHLRHRTLGEAGTPETLDELIAELAGRHLNRDHPLWQIQLVDGLPGGSQALVLLLHHGLADGSAVAAVLATLLDAETAPPPDVEAARECERLLVDGPPSRRRMLWDGVRHEARGLAGVPRLVARTRRNLIELNAREAESDIWVPKMGRDAPPTSLAAVPSLHRGSGHTSVAVDDVRAVKNAAGCTFTDVILAIVADALRSILQTRGEVPDGPLVANVPFSRPGDRPRIFGNHFSNYLTSLATDVDDPWERLLKITESSAEARRRLELFGPDIAADWLDLAPPALGEPVARRMARAREKRTMAGDGRPHADFSSLISNVPGTTDRWTLGPTTVSGVYMWPQTTSGEGVNVGAWRQGPRLCLAVMTNPEAVPRPTEVTDGMHAALEVLLAKAHPTSLDASTA